jgi:ribosome recycling factor
MIKELLSDAEARMKGAIHALEEDLAGIRTGRASPALVEKLLVEYYGTPTMLQQLATIAAPEPQLLTIRPFDPSSINIIEKAIRTSELGLNPSNDGKLIRLSIPSLTEERRLDLIKLVHKRLEEAKIAVRNVRRDTLEDMREFEKEKEISEDDLYRGKDELEKLTTRYVEQVDHVGTRKEQEIKEV